MAASHSSLGVSSFVIFSRVFRHSSFFSMVTTRVLIVEDDRDLAQVLTYNLKQAGYEVLVATDGREGLRQAELHSPDLVILDLMLPVMDGLDVCRRLRANSLTSDVSILMLTAKAEEMDQVVGFSIGADDYVTKPFSVKVLIQRVKALCRRRGAGEKDDADVISSQGIVVDRRAHRVTGGGKLLSLTRSELRILDTLVRQPGRVFRRTELIDAALGEDGLVLERTIDVHVRGLRRKMGDYGNLIETVRGVGYRFRDPVTR